MKTEIAKLGLWEKFVNLRLIAKLGLWGKREQTYPGRDKPNGSINLSKRLLTKRD